MSADAVFIGIDTGGTRTNVEVNVRGKETNGLRFESASVLSGAVQPSQYAPALRKILAPVEAYWDENEFGGLPVYMFVGAAGFAVSTRDDFMNTLHDVIPTILNKSVVAAGACNDAVALLCGLGSDAVVIAGTGSTVLVKDKQGALHVAGGHDWVACDYGSGFWIGMRGIRQACREFEAGNDTVLLQRLKQQYGIRSTDHRAFIAKLRDLAITDENFKGEIARFASSVCAAAERGDTEAQNIVKAEAEDLADSAASSLRRRFGTGQLSGGISLVECGGLFGNDFYRSVFEAQVQLRLMTSSDDKADIKWRRVNTGSEAVMRLAETLQGSTEELIKLDMAFRPVIVRF